MADPAPACCDLHAGLDPLRHPHGHIRPPSLNRSKKREQGFNPALGRCRPSPDVCWYFYASGMAAVIAPDLLLSQDLDRRLGPVLRPGSARTDTEDASRSLEVCQQIL